MIQRIQSVFLLLVTILMALTAFSPIFTISSDVESYPFFSFGVGDFSEVEFHTWGIFTFALLSSLLSLATIFIYKKRKVQIKLCYIIAVLIIAFYGTAIVYLNSYLGNVGESYTYGFQYGIILPFVALILDMLAIARINKDEKLVKSLDRIR